MSKWPEALKDDLRSTQDDRCHYCGADEAAAWHVDHKIPRSRGGTDDQDNLVWACAQCNMRKGRDHYDWFITRDDKCLANPWLAREVGRARARIERKPPAVISFDVSGVYGVEWQALGSALQRFAEYDGNGAEPVTREQFVEYVSMAAAALRFLDGTCPTCTKEGRSWDDAGPWWQNLVLPLRVEPLPTGGFMCFYECPRDGARWKCGWWGDDDVR